MITRRGLLQGILAAGIAPAVGTAGIIMPPRHVIVPEWGIGILTATDVQERQQELNSELAKWHAEKVDEAMFSAISERMRLTQEMIIYGILKGHA